MTRVLLLGAGGMLGRDLAATAPPGVEVLPRMHRDVDVADSAQVKDAIASVQPDVVINAAGYTNVDGAETERDLAFRVNAVAPGVIGRAAAGMGAFAVQFSSDYVFDGTRGRTITEDDTPAPLSAYGESKLEGERALSASGARHLVIRAQWLFGLHGRSFPRLMWERAGRREPTKVVNDQSGRPTFSHDLARAAWTVIGRRASLGDNFLHITNSGTATWYDVARVVFEAAGAADCLSPCSTAEYPRPARRPAWSVLDTTRFEALAGSALPSWEEALGRFLGLLSGQPFSIADRG